MKKQFYKWAFVLLGGPILFIKSLYGQSSQVLPEFDQIIVSDQVQVELVIADRYSLYLEGAMPELAMAKVVNRTLTLTAENANATKVKVFTKKITRVQIEGAARIESLDTLNGNQISISVKDASKAKLILDAQNAAISTEGASECSLSGKAEIVSVNVTDASKLTAQNLVIQTLTIETEGQAKAFVNVQNTIQAKVSDISKLTYSGSPVNKIIAQEDLAKVENIPQVADLKVEKDYGPLEIESAVDLKNNKPEPSDTTRVKIGKKRLTIIDEGDDEPEGKAYGSEERKHDLKSVWGGFELGVQGFTNNQLNFNIAAPYDFMTSDIGKSWFFGLNFPEFDAHIIQNKLAFTTGFGLLWNNTRFGGDQFLTPNIDSLSASASPLGVNLTKNKLYTFDLTAPLLIKWAPGRAKKEEGGFHFAAGAIIHYVAISRVVTETTSNGYKQRTELKDDFNINPFRVDATVRIGYDWFRLFANYSLTPYFNNTKAPDLRMFSAGITLVGF